MALDVVAQYSNVERSLNRYFERKLKDTEGIDIDFLGLKFEEKEHTEWLKPRILDIRSEYIGHASGTKYGEDADISFLVECFTKKGNRTIADRHYELRDIVANYFKIGEDIFIHDYVNGTPAGGSVWDADSWDTDSWATAQIFRSDKMRVRKFIADSPMPETQNLYQYLVGWEINYTRETTNP